eukprot:1339728-Heterocapsa_arctica.AAC.1
MQQRALTRYSLGLTLLRGRNADRPIQGEAPAGGGQILRMLFAESGQAAPGLGEANFPPLPEPIRPIGTGQGKGPAHRQAEALG